VQQLAKRPEDSVALHPPVAYLRRLWGKEVRQLGEERLEYSDHLTEGATGRFLAGASNRLDDGAEEKGLAQSMTVSHQYAPASQRGVGNRLAHQPGLPDARLSLHQDHTGRARRRFEKQPQLPLAPDDGGRGQPPNLGSQMLPAGSDPHASKAVGRGPRATNELKHPQPYPDRRLSLEGRRAVRKGDGHIAVL
jgi:hypothetical protein